MDIGKIEKVGDRELPGIPTFPKEMPAPRPQTQPEPSKAPVERPKEKVPA